MNSPSDSLRPFALGPWAVFPDLCLLRDASGAERRIEPRVMDVLTALARRAGEVVSKETLIAEVWGDTNVSGDGLFRHISELRRALGDDARSPQFIQTIPKRGYLLKAVPSRIAEGAEPGKTTTVASRGNSRAYRLVLLAAVVCGLVLTVHHGASAQAGRRERAARLASAAIGTDAFAAFARARVHDERLTCPSYRRARQAYTSALSAPAPFKGAANAYADVLIASAVLGCEPTESAMAALDKLIADVAGSDRLALSEADRLRLAAVRSLFTGTGAVRAGALLRAATAREPDLHGDILWAVQRAAMGDTAGAVTAARAALAADPAALGENWGLALTLYFDRRYLEAVAQLRATLEMYPESDMAANLLLLALAPIDVEGAAALARSWRSDVALTDAGRLGFAPAYVRALAGDTEPARRLLDAWPSGAAGWAPATGAAALARALGRADDQAKWLARALAEGDAWMLFRAIDPTLAAPAK